MTPAQAYEFSGWRLVHELVQLRDEEQFERLLREHEPHLAQIAKGSPERSRFALLALRLGLILEDAEAIPESLEGQIEEVLSLCGAVERRGSVPPSWHCSEMTLRAMESLPPLYDSLGILRGILSNSDCNGYRAISRQGLSEIALQEEMEEAEQASFERRDFTMGFSLGTHRNWIEELAPFGTDHLLLALWDHPPGCLAASALESAGLEREKLVAFITSSKREGYPEDTVASSELRELRRSVMEMIRAQPSNLELYQLKGEAMVNALRESLPELPDLPNDQLLLKVYYPAILWGSPHELIWQEPYHHPLAQCGLTPYQARYSLASTFILEALRDVAGPQVVELAHEVRRLALLMVV